MHLSALSGAMVVAIISIMTVAWDTGVDASQTDYWTLQQRILQSIEKENQMKIEISAGCYDSLEQYCKSSSAMKTVDVAAEMILNSAMIIFHMGQCAGIDRVEKSLKSIKPPEPKAGK